MDGYFWLFGNWTLTIPLSYAKSNEKYYSNISQTGCDSDHAEKYYIATICNWLKYYSHLRQLNKSLKVVSRDTLSKPAAQEKASQGKW